MPDSDSADVGSELDSTPAKSRKSASSENPSSRRSNDVTAKARGGRAKSASKQLAKKPAARVTKPQKSVTTHPVALSSPGSARLTDRQSQVLEVVKQHIDVHGLPPTRADIARELGFRSANAAEEHLRALARKGVIEMVPGASRGIRLPEEEGLPIVGRVAAGEPILAIEHVEDRCAVDPSLFHPRADFLLRVHGDSMVNIGIHDGDLLAVHQTQTADNGAIVVARVDDEVTVKRLKVKPGNSELELVPENDSMTPIAVDLATTPFTIEGISVGIIRNRM